MPYFSLQKASFPFRDPRCFILLDFDGIQEPERRTFLNQTPTSFYLSDGQVDRLIEAGGERLRDNPELRRLLADLRKP